MMIEKSRLRMYGCFRCSCGCGRLLGSNDIPYSNDDIIHIVGDFEKDEEGFYWRSFHPQCWKRLKLDEYSAEDIYNKYPPAPVA
jgi:hypothetical protein